MEEGLWGGIGQAKVDWHGHPCGRQPLSVPVPRLGGREVESGGSPEKEGRQKSRDRWEKEKRSQTGKKGHTDGEGWAHHRACSVGPLLAMYQVQNQVHLVGEIGDL